MNKITVMLESGLLSKEDADKLREAVLAQVREMTATRNEDGYSSIAITVSKQAAKHGTESQSNDDTTTMIVCDVCAITNTHKVCFVGGSPAFERGGNLV